MMFSDCLWRFVQLAGQHVPANQLGLFYLDAFQGALAPSTGMTRREIQALGRQVLRENCDLLLRECPATLTPLGTLLQDTRGELPDRTRPICCNSQLGTTIGTAIAWAHHQRFPGDTGGYLHTVFTKMTGVKRFNLFKPLGKAIVKHMHGEGVYDDAMADAWMIVKTNKEGALPSLSKPAPVSEEAPSTQKSSRGAVPETPKPDTKRKRPELPHVEKENPFTAEELAEILRGVEEDPKKSAEALQDVDIEEPIKVSALVNIKHPDKPPSAANVKAETFDDYKHVLKNDPAFVGMHHHPRHGLLLVMIAVDGVNDLGQTVYRGGAFFDPKSNKMITHKYISSVVGPFRWTDDEGAKYVVKGIQWRRGLCGKYWTNVDRGTSHDDVEDMKRWFLLTTDEETKQPLLRIWSGAKGEANYNAYLNGIRRRLRELRRDGKAA